MIYVNRDKFKRVNSNRTGSGIIDDRVQTITSQVNDFQRNMTKVYINPNFTGLPKSRKELLEEQSCCLIRNDKSKTHELPSTTLSEAQKLPGKTQQTHQHYEIPDGMKHQHTTEMSRPTSSERNSCKIFLNPQFQGSTNNVNNLTIQKLQKTKLNGPLQQDNKNLVILKTSLNKNVESSKKLKDDLSKKNSSQIVNKQKNETEGSKNNICTAENKKPPNKVFINPQFQSNQSKLVVVSTETSSGSTISKIHSEQQSKIMKHVAFSKNTPASSELSSSISNDIKKTARKRKLSASFLEPGSRSNTQKLLFVSKTKLVRNSLKLSVNSDKNLVMRNRPEPSSLTKSPLKSHNSFHFVSRHKITKKRKRSISGGSNGMKPNLAGKPSVTHSEPNVLTKSPLTNSNSFFIVSKHKITKKKKRSTSSNANLLKPSLIENPSPPLIKIKSKNGKSLKIVRNDQKQLLDSSGLQIHKKSTNTALQRKLQFSKINSSLNRSMLASKSKYIYKKKNLAVKKSISNIILKNKNIGNLMIRSSTDKVNFIKSKYRLIRKNCLNNINKSSRFSSEKSSQISKKWHNQKHSNKGIFKRNQKSFSIVNIGGVFYHCSRNSLTKNNASVKRVLLKDKSTTLQISGKRFKLENNGHTLKCLDRKLGRKRIDIGGITFISSSSGKSLTRTNYHMARSIILQARQKRISQLTRKLRKNNEHCPFFHRFGKCSGNELGTCTRQHDPKYVAVCKKFVQGTCSDSKCLLSHQISHHNLPTCQHFLAGQCGRDNCPYPHIKVSDDVPICIDFIKGFCLLGAQCAKRHLEICPAFEKGSCSRGKYCPYPHPKSKNIKQIKRNQIKKKPPTKAPDVVSSVNVRYFEDVTIQQENNDKLESKASEEEDETPSNDEKRIHPKRPRLGRLPSFIPLSFDKSFSEYSQDL